MGQHVHQIREELPWVLLFIASIWVVFGLEYFMPSLTQYGLIPRTPEGLTGILTMPFLHGSLSHILSNTFPLFVLMILLAGSRANSWTVVFMIIVIGNGLLWLLGRGDAIHIGASGLVFGLAIFLIASGFFERRFVPIIVAVVVGFLYGSSLIAGMMPFQDGVSWDGHLFGAIAGGIAAWWLARRIQDGKA
ncbi:rhomboid family intramembrane serine protease [Thiolinea disciformis]|uniref:rhomboid family intramembrane serine protease n=1 Tax=Thiolinea disciformis TaxID=125614 RepID=UPI0003694268|nr:rhomboid family intramembrane serine protease [Thiolinea disciformis]